MNNKEIYFLDINKEYYDSARIDQFNYKNVINCPVGGIVSMAKNLSEPPEPETYFLVLQKHIEIEYDHYVLSSGFFTLIKNIEDGALFYIEER